jgi:hypothetical protein
MAPSDSDLSCDEQLKMPTGEARAGSPTEAAPREKTARGLIVSWKMSTYYVPADSVVSYCKTPFKIEDPQALGSLLSSKCADKWLPVCKPEHLLMIKGKEGTAVYATFSVPGHPNEDRFIRNIHPSVAVRNFSKAVADIEADPTKAPQNERQKRRLEALNWKPSDCTGVQIDPKYNDWQPCAEEGLKSCRVDPTPTPRPAKREYAECAASGGGLPPGVKFIKRVDVCEDGSYNITKRPGAIFITQYETAAAAVPAAEPVEA